MPSSFGSGQREKRNPVNSPMKENEFRRFSDAHRLILAIRARSEETMLVGEAEWVNYEDVTGALHFKAQRIAEFFFYFFFW